MHVEPTDESMRAAIAYAAEHGPWDAFVAVGGGSAIDTAKAVNLLTTFPGELMDYLNAPVGRARIPPGELKPLFAVPTTAGTGAESTSVCIMDVLSMRVKTGISHWRLRPTMAVIDPALTMSLPPEVTAAAGMDILCHAAESYTAKWYADFEPKTAEQRVTYCGANPISDLWSEQALSLLARSFRRAVHEGDRESRTDMMMAATFAGMGFGNAGVHLPHANAYPIAGMVKEFRPAGYPQHEPMVPHGMAVSLTAPEAFRFGFDAAPERHLKVAALLAPDRRPGARPGRPAADGAGRPDARHRHPQRPRGSGLHRGGRRGPRAGHLEAAAAARHLRQDTHRGRHRGHPDPVPDQLVSRGPVPDLLGFVGSARSRDRAEPTNPSESGSGTGLAWSECPVRVVTSVVLRRRRVTVPGLAHPITYDPALPISLWREEIARTIAEHQVVVIAGETGSGKTTQIPKICLELGRTSIGHTQPRRIAARSVAERVAEELKSPLGELVGYQVRFTRKASAETRVKIMTDGVLLAEIGHDRDLRRYDTIIIDEAHERSLNIDFLLGYLKVLLPRRPDLKIIITSATIDTDRFAAHFAAADGTSAPIIEVSGRTYPVEVRYRPILADGEADQVGGICSAITELSAVGDGDILVFCSGEREIRDAADAITAMDLRRTEVLPLYARLSAAEQHRVFSAHTGRRIVLATNVAETSLTVPGIRYVVDPGTARMSRYSARTKVQRLPDRADLAGVGQPARRSLRSGRARGLHPAVRRGGLPQSAGVHRAGDPAHQPGLGDLADDRRRPGRDRHLPVRGGAGLQSDQRRSAAAERARGVVVRAGGAADGSPASAVGWPRSPSTPGWAGCCWPGSSSAA